MRFGVGLFSLQCTAMQPVHWAATYREMREHAALLEELGYDELWLSEHHFYYDGYCPALLPAAASVLSVTERLRVGTGMLLLPLQDPHRLALVAHDLNSRSGGRLDLGVGLGYRDVEFDGHGISRRQRLARLLAGLDVLEAEEARGGASVWMGAGMMGPVRRAGARGHPILLSAALPVAMCRDLAAAHQEGWEQAGRPGGTKPALGALRNIWLTEDPREREAALDWVRASYVQYAGLGWAVPQQGEHSRMDFLRETDKAIQISVDTTITGSADRVVEELRELEQMGMEHVAFRLILDGAPRAAVEDQIRRLATDVVPRLASPVAA